MSLPIYERFQERNRKIALSRIESKIAAAARIEKKRRATKPTKASRERRLKIKKLRADIKKKQGKNMGVKNIMGDDHICAMPIAEHPLIIKKERTAFLEGCLKAFSKDQLLFLAENLISEDPAFFNYEIGRASCRERV